MDPEIKNIPEQRGPDETGISSDTIARLQEYSIDPEKTSLIVANRDEIESLTYPKKGGRQFGAVPFMSARGDILNHFPEEMDAMTGNGKYYKPGGAKPWSDRFYAEGTLLYEMKFGKRLSEFSKEILENYPEVATDGEAGKEISIFGLSGSGKSTAIEAIKKTIGENVVVMDSDTVRYNLFAKKIKDVELDNGAPESELKSLMNNKISGALYFLLNTVKHELKERGYTVVTSSTEPSDTADMRFYIEHPDGIDPANDAQVPEVTQAKPTDTEEQKTERAMAERKVAEIAAQLQGHTDTRITADDDYDWKQARTVTRFEDMVPVNVQVPAVVHGFFLQNLKRSLKQEGIVRIANTRTENAEARQKNFERQFATLIKKS
jgi:hypothetical protein